MGTQGGSRKGIPSRRAEQWEGWHPLRLGGKREEQKNRALLAPADPGGKGTTLTNAALLCAASRGRPGAGVLRGPRMRRCRTRLHVRLGEGQGGSAEKQRGGQSLSADARVPESRLRSGAHGCYRSQSSGRYEKENLASEIQNLKTKTGKKKKKKKR